MTEGAALAAEQVADHHLRRYSGEHTHAGQARRGKHTLTTTDRAVAPRRS
ncbi:hypothetical protein OSH40_19285 [Mycobacterium ulcerans]